MPAGSHVRPTSDKVKQALFNILGERVLNAAFLDLFAGTGGIGLEAISRGASRAVFVDDGRDSLAAIKKNIDQAGFQDKARVVAAKVDNYLKKADEEFDIIFLDPPYTLEQEPILNLIDNSRILKPHGTVVAEHFKKMGLPVKAGSLILQRDALYGDTVLSFYRLKERE